MPISSHKCRRVYRSEATPLQYFGNQAIIALLKHLRSYGFASLPLGRFALVIICFSHDTLHLNKGKAKYSHI